MIAVSKSASNVLYFPFVLCLCTNKKNREELQNERK